MNVLFFSYYYFPDYCAGSFRAKGLIDSLLKSEKIKSVLLITTQPNRYGKKLTAPVIERSEKLTLYRVWLPAHNNVFYRQVFSYIVYLVNALRIVITVNYSPTIILSTSSRTGTSFIGFLASKIFGKPLYSDIRDIFSDNLSAVLRGKFRLFTAMLSSLESRIVHNSHWVNFVSPGFRQFYPLEPSSKINIFTNGIDDEFMDAEKNGVPSNSGKRKSIVYAGNIGFGQNLEKILPPIAKKYSGEFDIYIIGDGSSKYLLQDVINKENINNLILMDPIPRKELIGYYNKADILFFHLADVPAFRNVIPSKVFEYSVFNKPILAGISGVSQDFCKEKIPGTYLFAPEDINGAISEIEKIKSTGDSKINRDIFINNYSRNKIMDKMVSSIIANAQSN